MAKKKAEAHHGGAWKVAYADFVTAMMALFMVLWICAQDQKILIATSRYFQSPFSSPLPASAGLLQFDAHQPSNNSLGDDQAEQSRLNTDARQIDLQFLNSVAKDLYRLLNLDENLADKPIDIQITSDGLRITLFDRARQPLFQPASAEFTEWGRFVMESLAWMIDRNGFLVVIEGHTRPGLPPLRPDYGPWELSSDRSNAARRALTHYAVDPALIQRVTGYADTRPVPLLAADNEGHQRVTLSLAPRPRPAKAAAPPASPPLASSSGDAAPAVSAPASARTHSAAPPAAPPVSP